MDWLAAVRRLQNFSLNKHLGSLNSIIANTNAVLYNLYIVTVWPTASVV
jgi:hypothetical protein